MLQTMQVDIARNGPDAALDGLRGLVARRGAQIEKGLAGMEIEERHNGLRSDVLDAAGAGDVGLGRLKERGCDLGSPFRGRIGDPIVPAARRAWRDRWRGRAKAPAAGRFFSRSR